MSTTQHPAREAGQTNVEVGQLWLWNNREWRITGRHPNGTGWLVNDTTTIWFGDENFLDPGVYGGPMTLISPAPAPDRCKAPEWCGLGEHERGTAKHEAWVAAFRKPGGLRGGKDYVADGKVIHCSESCAAKRKAPDRSGCEAWCGHDYRNIRDLGVAIHAGWKKHRTTVAKGNFAWCSKSCLEQRLPPIGVPAGTGEAKPEVTVVCRVCKNINGCCCAKPATAATPAKREAVCGVCGSEALGPYHCGEQVAPRCGNNGCETPYQNVAQRWCQSVDENGMKTGAVLEWSCEPCHLLDEAEWEERMMFEVTGKPLPADAPALIDRRLRRDAGIEDNCWEDA